MPTGALLQRSGAPARPRSGPAGPPGGAGPRPAPFDRLRPSLSCPTCALYESGAAGLTSGPPSFGPSGWRCAGAQSPPTRPARLPWPPGGPIVSARGTGPGPSGPRRGWSKRWAEQERSQIASSSSRGSPPSRHAFGRFEGEGPLPLQGGTQPSIVMSQLTTGLHVNVRVHPDGSQSSPRARGSPRVSDAGLRDV